MGKRWLKRKARNAESLYYSDKEMDVHLESFVVKSEGKLFQIR